MSCYLTASLLCRYQRLYFALQNYTKKMTYTRAYIIFRWFFYPFGKNSDCVAIPWRKGGIVPHETSGKEKHCWALHSELQGVMETGYPAGTDEILQNTVRLNQHVLMAVDFNLFAKERIDKRQFGEFAVIEFG